MTDLPVAALLEAMRQTARHFLRIFLVAVAFAGSGFSGYSAIQAAFDDHAHERHGFHSHAMHHDHGAAAPDHDEPGDLGDVGDHTSCEHMHVQCCGSIAVPASECGVKFGDQSRAKLRIAELYIPHGQLTSPLFRPPSDMA